MIINVQFHIKLVRKSQFVVKLIKSLNYDNFPSGPYLKITIFKENYWWFLEEVYISPSIKLEANQSVLLIVDPSLEVVIIVQHLTLQSQQF